MGKVRYERAFQMKLVSELMRFVLCGFCNHWLVGEFDSERCLEQHQILSFIEYLKTPLQNPIFTCVLVFTCHIWNMREVLV
jgi:hypothetical protein